MPWVFMHENGLGCFGVFVIVCLVGWNFGFVCLIFFFIFKTVFQFVCSPTFRASWLNGSVRDLQARDRGFDTRPG